MFNLHELTILANKGTKCALLLLCLEFVFKITHECMLYLKVLLQNTILYQDSLLTLATANWPRMTGWPNENIVWKPAVKINGNLHWTVIERLIHVSFLSEFGLWERGRERGERMKYREMGFYYPWWQIQLVQRHKWAKSPHWHRCLCWARPVDQLMSLREVSPFLHGIFLDSCST